MQDKIKFEYRSLAILIVSGYWLSLLIGSIGLFYPRASHEQLLFYQINDALAVTASVLAARYVGLRGEHVAASAFILLGITHGVSMASSGLENFNVERGTAMIMPMVPALGLIGWCSLFPLWLRILGITPVVFFTWMYIDVIHGGVYYDTPLWLGYLCLAILELTWSVYIYIDWKRMVITEKMTK